MSIAIYRGAMADSIPNGVPSEAAATARDTLGGALAVVGQLPEQLGAMLLETAQAAFTFGLQITVGIGATLAILVAIVTVVLLRRVGTG